MTNFDPLDTLLRDALVSDAVPAPDFTDKVMRRVATAPQEKKLPRRYTKWLVSAAACIVLVGAALPLLQGGNSADGEAYNSSGVDTAMPYVNDEAYDDTVADCESTEQAPALPTDSMAADGAASERKSLSPDSIEDRIEAAAEELAQQGYTLEVVAITDSGVQVALSGEYESEEAQQALCDAMTANGFVARDGWYVMAEEDAP